MSTILKHKLPAKFRSKLLRDLKGVYRVSQLQSASFSMNKEEDAFIKEKIRLWVGTWIEHPVKVLIDEIEAVIESPQHYYEANGEYLP